MGWDHWDDHPETRRLLHMRALPGGDVDAAIVLLADGCLDDVERFMFPVNGDWGYGEDWSDGCLLRFRSSSAPPALATRLRAALDCCSAWAIHDGGCVLSEEPVGGPVGGYLGAESAPSEIGVVAVMLRPGQVIDAINTAQVALGCGEPFRFADGALYFVQPGNLIRRTAKIRNHFAHVGGWDGDGSFYNDSTGHGLWSPVNFEDLAFQGDEGQEPEEW